MVVNGETLPLCSSSNLFWMSPIDEGGSCPENYCLSPLSKHS